MNVYLILSSYSVKKYYIGATSSSTRTRRGRRLLLFSSATVSSFRMAIISSRKKLKCTSVISRTTGKNLANQALTCSHAEELKTHCSLSPISSGNPAGLQCF